MRPRLLTLLVLLPIALLSQVALAADPGTEAFVRDAMYVLQTMDLSMESVAVRNGYSDRELHFLVSVPLGAAGTQLAHALLEQRGPRWLPLVLGSGFGLLPGLAKEFLDMAQPTNYFSWKDLGFDALGAVTGALFVWSVHRALERRHRSADF